MFEAKLVEAGFLKKLLDAAKELVPDANFECNSEGIILQATDNSHGTLVSVLIRAKGFERFRCDRPMPLGVNLSSLSKVLECAKDDDTCTLKALDDADTLNLIYEAKRSGHIAEYDMKLMDVGIETLTISDTEYDARITMASSEFARLVRNLGTLGESVRIDVSKEGVRFTCDGETANANILLKHSDEELPAPKTRKIKKEDEEEEEEKEEKPDSDGEEEQEEEDEEETGHKRKKKAKVSKKKKDESDDDSDFDDTPPVGVIIELSSHVSLTFSLKYLVNVAKSSNLCGKVQLLMSSYVPLLVSFDFKQGHIRYYIAPND
ncbi:hypothetical protein M378DRAFT_181522 [Amanita muscaria Koide BX008]|uniref:DNA sliding clamp PCNA n=1 Tax=Amanita muscaria (strain Koide BX008) TaxID=946122 RepID=A0A0C2SUM6_AMAMK|nr:hypothetical protein M378DRAFT_181522 [Amanita muscaria Koide BX008]